MDLGLKGKRVIIGGAARGIGRAVTELLAAEGAHLGIFGRNAEAISAHADALSKRGGKVVAETFTFTEREAYRGLLGTLAERLGGCDIFIHNISSSGAQATGDWEQTFKLDVLGAVDGCETLEPHLGKSGAGAVILMSSTAAVETFLVPQAFNALKGSLITYGKQLSQAWAPKGIRVNMVSPGPVAYPGGNWDGIKAVMPQLYDATLAAIPMGRFGAPDDVARAVAFLASSAASYITGTNLIVDGGYTKRVQF